MIARLLLVSALAAAGLAPSTSAHAARCTWTTQTHFVDGLAEIRNIKSCEGATSGSGSSASDAAAGVVVTDMDLDTPCVRSAITIGTDPVAYCAVPAEPAEPTPTAAPQVTPGLALTALRRVTLPESRLQVQPPDGETLVNFETNFFTEAQPFSRTLRMLGRQVELRIWPSRFRWRFGDGASRETTSPGATYPQLEVTHAYRRAGQVSPAVDTTYSAEFRVDGRAWRTVPGTVTMTGRPETLQVRTARPTLVGPQ